MFRAFFVAFMVLLICPALFAQSNAAPEPATISVQSSPAFTATPAESAEPQIREIKIPAGTALDIQATHSVSSIDAKVGDLISFRVLIPVKVGDAIVIGGNALVTGRIAKSKRAGHWGKAGKLAWTM